MLTSRAPRLHRRNMRRDDVKPHASTVPAMDIPLNSGDTAWVLISAALVLLMTPGLALFYGGMVRSKSVLNMMMMSFGSMATVSVVWALWGFSMAFGNSKGGLVG